MEILLIRKLDDYSASTTYLLANTILLSYYLFNLILNYYTEN